MKKITIKMIIQKKKINKSIDKIKNTKKTLLIICLRIYL